MRLTKRSIEALAAPAKPTTYHDDEVRGLALRCLPSGRRSWILRYWTRSHRDRVYTIGDAAVLTPDAARAEARRLLGVVATGGDPLADLQAARGVPTVRQIGVAFLAWVEKNRKPRTLAQYRSAWQTAILPEFGSLRASEVTGEAVADLMEDMADRPFAANMALAVLCSAWAVAKREKMIARGPLPWADVSRYPSPRRKRRLSPEEIATVWVKLDAFATDLPAFRSLIRLLILTGCRVSEWRDALWSWVDLEAGALRLPDSKVGPREIRLPPEAVAILRDLPRESVYVFPGRSGGPMSAHCLWGRFRKFAGVSDIRIHDLRRTHGSVALECGLNVREVADLLGHSSTKSTEIYLAGVKDREAENVGKVSAQIVAFTRVTKEKKKGLA